LSIVPKRDKKNRIIILPSYKIKEVDVSSSRTNTVSVTTRNIKNVEMALAECRRERDMLRELKEQDYDKELAQKVGHYSIVLSKYRLFCIQKNTDIMFTVCKGRRFRKECLRLCVEARRFMGI